MRLKWLAIFFITLSVRCWAQPSVQCKTILSRAVTLNVFEQETLDRYRKLSTELRGQMNKGRSLEKLEVKTELVQEELQTTLDFLNKAKATLPAKTGIETSQVQVDINLSNLIRNLRKKLTFPQGPDKILVTELTQRLNSLIEQETVNYLDLLKLISVSVWIATPASNAKLTTSGQQSYFSFAASITEIHDDEIRWNLSDPFIFNGSIKNHWKKLKDSIPVYSFLRLAPSGNYEFWREGIALIEADFRDRSEKNSTEHLALTKAERDWDHRDGQAEGTNNLYDFYHFNLKVSEIMKKDQLGIDDVILIQRVLHYITHEHSIIENKLIFRRVYYATNPKDIKIELEKLMEALRHSRNVESDYPGLINERFQMAHVKWGVSYLLRRAPSK